MELYVCGFNAHKQLLQSSEPEIIQFKKAYQSPKLQVRCALWSSMITEDGDVLIHTGFRSLGKDPVAVAGPPPSNITSVFGDINGVLGALTKDGSLYVSHIQTPEGGHPSLMECRFDDESSIRKQKLAIIHLAIADTGEVCIITSGSY